MALFLLLLALAAGLVMLPFGLPGLWLMLASVGLYAWLGPQGAIGPWTVGVVAGLAIAAEIGEFAVTVGHTRRSGGSSRGAWWALGGSVIGALAGVPIPVAGSLIGAFVGAFVGAWLGELSLGRAVGDATQAATGALIGRALSVALKVAVGVVIAVWIVGVIVFNSSM